jgi:hypothetical protein
MHRRREAFLFFKTYAQLTFRGFISKMYLIKMFQKIFFLLNCESVDVTTGSDQKNISLLPLTIFLNVKATFSRFDSKARHTALLAV